MSKKINCPNCGSHDMQMDVQGYSATIWKCKRCGYSGPIAIMDGNIEKQLKEVHKMDKLSKKLLRGR